MHADDDNQYRPPGLGKKIVDEVLKETDDKTRGLFARRKRMMADYKRKRQTTSFGTSSSTSQDPQICVECRGTGKLECPQCDGNGWFYPRRGGPPETDVLCNGTGQLPCRPCQGTGYR